VTYWQDIYSRATAKHISLMMMTLKDWKSMKAESEGPDQMLTEVNGKMK